MHCPSALRAGEPWRADIRAAPPEKSPSKPRPRAVPADSPKAHHHHLQLQGRRIASPDRIVPRFGTGAARRPDIANDEGNPRAGERLALGTGTDVAPQGNASAAAVHVGGGGQNNTMKISQSNSAARRRQRGSAVVVYLALLGIMVFCPPPTPTPCCICIGK